MKRRDFLKQTAPAILAVALAPIILTHLSEFTGGESVLVGYKGTMTSDVGYFYCPYTPVMYTGVKPTVPDGVKVTPIKFKTRYDKNGMALYG